MSKYLNPIITGCYPDPSICRVKNHYYLVTSSFEYFPAIPIFESKDLINWKSLGCVLNRKEQVNLSGCNGHNGIFAPTIRYHNGVFYVVATNVSHGGHFLVTTKDPKKGWSDPIYIKQEGIDPSLYFEGENVYFLSTANDKGKNAILLSKLNLKTGKTRCRHYLWHGTGGRYLEGPHLYKINGFYYLLASEGGTEYGDMLVLARSKDLLGKYISCPDNPILTNRNLGGYELQGTGHGDLVQDINGKWWIVFLGFRQIGEYLQFHTLGREVNLLPVVFKNNWLSVKDNIARMKVFTKRKLPRQFFLKDLKQRDLEIGKDLVFIRNPKLDNYELRLNTFKLKGDHPLSDRLFSPTALFIRQRTFHDLFSAKVNVKNAMAGLTIYLEPDQHYDLILEEGKGEWIISRRLVIGPAIDEKVIARVKKLGKNLLPTLTIKCKKSFYLLEAYINRKSIPCGSFDARFLSSEVAGDFTGVMLGIFVEKSGVATFSDIKVQRYGSKLWKQY